MTILIWFGVAYCILDIVTGFVLGRCVMPGLKCSACRASLPTTKEL